MDNNSDQKQKPLNVTLSLDELIEPWHQFVKNELKKNQGKMFLTGGAALAISLMKHTKDVINLNHIQNIIRQNIFCDFDLIYCSDYCMNEEFVFGAKEYHLYLHANRDAKFKEGKIGSYVLKSRFCDDIEMIICSSLPSVSLKELPMTTLLIPITMENLHDIFSWIYGVSKIKSDINKSFSFYQDFNIYSEGNFFTEKNIPDFANFEVIIPTCTSNGLFKVENNPVQWMGLSIEIRNAIKKVSKNASVRQFLICMIRNPTNISRLYSKNKIRAIKCRDICMMCGCNTPRWVMDIDFCIRTMDIFISVFSNEVIESFISHYDMVINKMIKKITNLKKMYQTYNYMNKLSGIGGDPDDVMEYLKKILRDRQDFVGCSYVSVPVSFYSADKLTKNDQIRLVSLGSESDFIKLSPGVIESIKGSKFIMGMHSKKRGYTSDNIIKSMTYLMSEIYPESKCEITYDQIDPLCKYGEKAFDNKIMVQRLEKSLMRKYTIFFSQMLNIFEGVNLVRFANYARLYGMKNEQWLKKILFFSNEIHTDFMIKLHPKLRDNILWQMIKIMKDNSNKIKH